MEKKRKKKAVKMIIKTNLPELRDKITRLIKEINSFKVKITVVK